MFFFERSFLLRLVRVRPSSSIFEHSDVLPNNNKLQITAPLFLLSMVTFHRIPNLFALPYCHTGRISFSFLLFILLCSNSQFEISKPFRLAGWLAGRLLVLARKKKKIALKIRCHSTIVHCSEKGGLSIILSLSLFQQIASDKSSALRARQQSFAPTEVYYSAFPLLHSLIGSLSSMANKKRA